MIKITVFIATLIPIAATAPTAPGPTTPGQWTPAACTRNEHLGSAVCATSIQLADPRAHWLAVARETSNQRFLLCLSHPAVGRKVQVDDHPALPVSRALCEPVSEGFLETMANGRTIEVTPQPPGRAVSFSLKGFVDRLIELIEKAMWYENMNKN